MAHGYDDAINAVATDALRHVKDTNTLGLGSGRAATAFVKALGTHIRKNGVCVRCVPTSLQIKLVAEQNDVPLIEADQIHGIDTVFDGADQIDSCGFMVKGGGGALFRESMLIGAAKKVVIMADATKFVKHINMPVPIEVHPHARRIATEAVRNIGGKPVLRTGGNGYPFFTENQNVILDCDFGTMQKPGLVLKKLVGISGVIKVGIFSKPHVTYKAKTRGRFENFTR